MLSLRQFNYPRDGQDDALHAGIVQELSSFDEMTAVVQRKAEELAPLQQ